MNDDFRSVWTNRTTTLQCCCTLLDKMKILVSFFPFYLCPLEKNVSDGMDESKGNKSSGMINRKDRWIDFDWSRAGRLMLSVIRDWPPLCRFGPP